MSEAGLPPIGVSMRVAAIAYLERSPEHGGLEATRLFEEHSEWLYRYCLRQLSSSTDAEDAVQTTFLHALRALQRGVAPDSEEAWLTVIARNVCHTHRRTLGRRGALASDVDLDAIAGGPTDESDEDRLIGLRDALASLPESQRRALVLREWHGVPSQEIATHLNLSAPATHALLTRARRSLARALTVPRPAAGFDFGWLLYKLEAPLRLLGGAGMAKATAVTVAAGIVAGGIALERETSPPSRDERSGISIVSTTADSPNARAPNAGGESGATTRAGAAPHVPTTGATASERVRTGRGTILPPVAPAAVPDTVMPPPAAPSPAPGQPDDPLPPIAPVTPPPILEPPIVAQPRVPSLEPTTGALPLPLPPVPDPTVELPAVPAPPSADLPLP